MPTIRQHIPAFHDFLPGPPERFETLFELLTVSFVENWYLSPDFARFRADPYDRERLLIAEMTDGQSWVVGVIDGWPFPGSEHLET